MWPMKDKEYSDQILSSIAALGICRYGSLTNINPSELEELCCDYAIFFIIGE